MDHHGAAGRGDGHLVGGRGHHELGLGLGGPGLVEVESGGGQVLGRLGLGVAGGVASVTVGLDRFLLGGQQPADEDLPAGQIDGVGRVEHGRQRRSPSPPMT